MLFTWAQWLRGQEDLWEEAEAEASASDHEGTGSDARDSNGTVSAEQYTSPQDREAAVRERDGRGSPGGDPGGRDTGGGPLEIIDCPPITHGEPFTERKSTFQVP